MSVQTPPARGRSALAAPARGGAQVPVQPGQHGADADRTVGVRSGRVRRAFEGTPGRLRVVAAATVIACLAFAVLGALVFQDRRAALADARAHAAQLVRVQEISTNLVRADAAATNAFLAQGKGLPSQLLMQTYEDAVSTAARRIVDAARAEPADGPDLARVNDQLTDYTARIAAALRVKRVQTTPTLATGYLGLASQTTLREGMLPALDRIVASDAQRVDDAFATSDRAGLLFLVLSLVVLAVLVVCAVWLARRTRRVFNLPLTAATAAVLVTAVVGGVVLIAVAQRASEVRSTSYAATRALAETRIAAYRAKADESITLIRQNFSLVKGRYEDPGKATIERARTQLAAAEAAGFPPPEHDPLAAWTAVHDTIIKLVNQGKTDEAQRTATASSPGSSNATFEAFESASQQGLADQATSTADGLASSSWLLLASALVALIVGVLAAAGAWLGLSQRLEEYR